MTNDAVPYANIKVEIEGPLGIVTLDRPRVLNALSSTLMGEVGTALAAFDEDEAVRCIIITGGPTVFAAGADIKEMANMSAASAIDDTRFRVWDRVYHTQKPLIAAVCGLAYGGGCELAMLCDMIVAAETARFGQPEINLGIIPGAGGTQRLIRAIGKARAMEIILTGQPFSAQDAYTWGLVNRLAPADQCLGEAKKLGGMVAQRAPLAVRAAKQAILRSYETSQETGLAFERQSFYSLFATEDQREGMQAFIEKRQPNFTGR